MQIVVVRVRAALRGRGIGRTAAAALAEAQRTGAVLISTLDGQLHQLDNQIGQAMEEDV